MEDPKDKIDYNSLRKYIKILEDLNDKDSSASLSSLSKDLLVNFGLKISVEKLIEFYEPTIDELVEDLEIQHRNVF